MGGKACIRGMRVTVGNIVGQIGAGRSAEDVLSDYPYLEREVCASLSLHLHQVVKRTSPPSYRTCSAYQ
jgi:hypothetical protein